jgi:aspartyl-tRNA(Asn)/glutamyl-tRNA(Gln) amidotransferase subunit B
MPKNYQITQYDQPSTRGRVGRVRVRRRHGRVRITRAHLEEDVGKNTHFDRHSGVDFNRAGVPLLEIVSEPDLTSADMAHAYLNALTDILVYGWHQRLRHGEGHGPLRRERLVRPKGATQLGAKIEIKNMNTFSGVRRALEYEIPRQIEAVKRGEACARKPGAGTTTPASPRTHAHQGGRARLPLLPDPDLCRSSPPRPGWPNAGACVELPLARKQRFMRDYQLPAGDAEVFKNERPARGLLRAAAGRSANPKTVANWVINNLPPS